MNETFEPDYKRLFYSLALRLVTAQAFLRMGKVDEALVSVDEAVRIVVLVDNAPTPVNSGVFVKQ
jgi:hypothetical protein